MAPARGLWPLTAFGSARWAGRARARAADADADAGADKLARENTELRDALRNARTVDALTGLPNRQRLLEDLDLLVPAATEESPLVLALFELHGLRRVNETYGHATGDALLARLGRGLERTLSTHGTAYRLGGDEFGALWLAHVDGASLALAAAALSETGDLGRVDCSFVSASIPAEAATPDGAFGLVTSRMHAWKTLHRNGASRQSRDVLVRVLAERSPDLDTHSDGVSELAEATARKLGLQDDDVRLIRLAAELHDVGKSALPDSILNKPGPLDATEWEFMRRHTLIGERIVAAAAALTPVAHLVRSSHERLDGDGYPDGLAGDEIPLGARILAVCDAYDAMVSDRSYRRGMPMHEAVAELRRCAGSQFDPRVVDAFCSLTLSPGAETRAA